MTTARGATQTVRYFASGDVADLTDPVGKVVSYTYDDLGQVLTETEVTDAYPTGLVTTYTYDKLGRRMTETASLCAIRNSA